MTPRTLIILVALGIVAIAGGWYFGVATLPSNQRAADTGTLMFPDLAPRLQQATKIEVVHQGKPMTIERREVAGQTHWGLADRGGYPVQETKLRSMLTALTELRLVEQRTADPTQFATLGVEDPTAKDSNSNLLSVLDISGKPIVALIVGHRRVRTGGNVPEEVYVRRPNENQSWLAEGSLEVDADPQLWLDRDIMNIDHSRIAKVVVTHGDETLEFARANDKLALNAPAEHPKLDDYKLEDVSRALELLTFEDVQPDAAPPAATPPGTTPPAVTPPAATPPGAQVGRSVFSTSDGLTITVSVYQAPQASAAKLDAATKPDADHDVLARFSATDDDKTKAEADRLQARLAGWTYQLGAWKQKSLVPSIEDLKAAASEKPAAPEAASPGTAPATEPTTPGAAPGSTPGAAATTPEPSPGAAPTTPEPSPSAAPTTPERSPGAAPATPGSTPAAKP
jgi:hypothetical protein